MQYPDSERIQKSIHLKCLSLGMSFDSRGYVKEFEHNLIKGLPNWEIIKNEINQGGGGELKQKGHTPAKFKAIHSSAALCINNFAFIKENLKYFSLRNYSNFSKAIFEAKLSTGISTPNLDFMLTSSDAIVGIESKFIETLKCKLPNWIDKGTPNLTKYLLKKNSLNLPNGFEKEILEYYSNFKEKTYLDIAQLIKHSLGLLNLSQQSQRKKPVLVYLYWLPLNWSEFQNYNEHAMQVVAFRNRIKNYIDFIPLSYLEFWESIESVDIYKKYFVNIKERYCFNS